VQADVVGRDRELDAIGAALAGVREGEGTLVAVRGEGGIGKTALLDAVEAAADGALVIRITGHEADVDLPFVALADGLRSHRDRLAALTDREREALESALALGAPAPVEPLAVYAALLALCSFLAEDAPLLILVDDAQWLDGATADALLFLGRRVADAGIALLVASRAAADRWTRLAALELRLGGLELDASRELLARTGAFSDDVAGRLHAATSGNPLALLTVPAALNPAQRVGAEPLQEPLRADGALEAALLDRIDALAPTTKAALVVLAAAAGEDAAPIAHAPRELGIDLDSLAEAERAGIVRLEPGVVTFTHPLYRSAVYHNAPRDERRAAHRALANALQDATTRPRRALHLVEATIEPDDEVAAELEAAAAELTSRAAHPQAGMFLERAAALSPDPGRRAARLVVASAAVRERGDGARAAELARAAQADAASLRDQAEADAALGRALMVTGPMDEASALLGSAGLAVAEDEPLVSARWLIDAADTAFSAGDDRGGRELARAASRLLSGTDAPERFAALAWIAFARVAAGDVRHVDLVARLISENHGVTAADERVAAAAATLLLFADRYGEAAEYSALVASRARAEGRLTLLVDASRNLAQARLRLGDFTEAAAVATDALLLAEGADQSVQLTGLLLDVGECAAWRGDEAELERCASRGLELAQELGIRALIPSYERLRGLLALGLGRIAEAAERFERTLAEDIAQHPGRFHSSRPSSPRR